MSRPIIKMADIAAAFNPDDLRRRFPPILTVAQVAELLGLGTRKTIYIWIAKGRLNGAFRKRGKHHLFWRDRVIDLIFNGKEWNTDDI
jgi:excisionase family DNA binding protein